MYIPRLLATTLSEALGQFPAVLVTGPRQSGKTTFLLEEFGRDSRYLRLDDPLERSLAAADPNAFLDRFPGERLILDEVQYAPELLPCLKVRIDRERNHYGRWMLTGSQQFQLMAHVSESLAGRVAILELLPLSLLESVRSGTAPDLGSVIWNGSYPEPSLQPKKRDLWISSYIQTYIEGDVHQILKVRDLRTFETVLGLCASQHGQEVNLSNIARTAGIAVPTILNWIHLLEAAYILRFLPPYFEDYGKRVTEAPKLYFLDSALVCDLTSQPSGDAAIAGPLGGSLFEGWIVAETFKVFAMIGKRPDLYFWRSQDGLEVDLVLRLPNGLVPIEVRLTDTPTPRHTDSLTRFRTLASRDAAPQGILVCRTAERTALPGGNLALPWQEYPAWLREQLLD